MKIDTPNFIAEVADIRVKILLDSITEGGSRLITYELTYPRMIHSEFMTHRMVSRNSASSRAIPAAKLRERVMRKPAIPVHWGANQKGMQAESEVADKEQAVRWWLGGLNYAIATHEEGERLGLHKQIVNRVIEPWMSITVIASGTDWANLFYLRDHRDAEPSFRQLAKLMREAYYSNLPREVPVGEWHLPLLFDGDVEEAANHVGPNETVNDVLKKLSTGRCARVSYLTHEGRRDLAEDIRLHDQLAATATAAEAPMHASPLEHPAVAIGGRTRCRNFEGWKQYRAFFPREAGPDTSVRCERCGIWNGLHVQGCPRA